MSSFAAALLRRSVPALLTLLLIPGLSLASPLFPNPVYGVGSYPISVVSADLNGDGLPDLVTVNRNSGDVSILLALPEGEFAPEARVTVESHPIAAAVGDFNGDRMTDLAVCSTDSPSNLALLLGHGDGSFRPPAFVSSPGDCSDIVAADFNNDRKADVALLSRTLGSVTVLLGRGDGTFNPGMGTGGLFSPAAAMTLGDFNRDGKQDLAVGSGVPDFPDTGYGYVTLLLGRGDGTFTPSIIAFTDRGGILDLTTADFNRDGAPDLVMSTADGTLSVLLGQGNGTFLRGPGLFVGPGGGLFDLIARDINSDGRVDLTGTLTILWGTPGPGGNVFVLPGRGDGTFDPMIYSLSNGAVSALLPGDFDGDGRIDLATTSFYGNSVAILAGHGNGTFGPVPAAAIGSDAVSLAVGDLDRDGRPDLMTANLSTSSEFSVLLGRGDGSLEPQVGYEAGSNLQAALLADLDGDGNLDLAASTLPPQSSVHPFISARLGHGDGSFGSEIHIPLPSLPASLVSGDFNRDGRADLAAASPSPGEILILQAVESGLLAPPVSIPFASARYLAMGDFNRDGIPDLAATGYSASGVAVLRGRGDGTFDPPQPPGPGVSWSITSLSAPGDLDGDGNEDAVLTIVSPPALLFLRGKGDGTFEPPSYTFLPSRPWAVAVGDFDLDRRKDLAVTERDAGEVVILMNLGGGAFAPAGRFVATSLVAAADLDGDGWKDLVSASGGNVLFLLNQGIPGVVPDRPPVANAGPDVTLECASPSGSAAQLDGSGSSDPDSTPGTNDDIVLYQWFEGFGGPSPVLLGTGETLTVALPLGVHTITLKVTDAAGASATDTVVVTVADTTAPSLSLSVSPAILWPPNHRMSAVQASAATSDACGPANVVLETILSSEPEDSGGMGAVKGGNIQEAGFGTADFLFSLRAERSGSGTGRTYTIAYSATDSSGNTTRSTATVLVPHDRGDIVPGSLKARRAARPAVPLWDPSQLQDPAP